MNTGRSARRRLAAEQLLELLDVLLGWSDDRTGRRSPRRSSRPASGGTASRARSSAVEGLAQRRVQRSRPRVDPVEQLADGQGPVALDDAEPERRRSRSARTAPRRPADRRRSARPHRARTGASRRHGRGPRAAPRTLPGCDRSARPAATARRRRRGAESRSDAAARGRRVAVGRSSVGMAASVARGA